MATITRPPPPTKEHIGRIIFTCTRGDYNQLCLVNADGTGYQQLTSLEDRLASRWSLATALAFLAWFIFAPQCISTIAVTRRETNSWKWTGFMVGYLFILAYIAAGATYWTAVAFGLG